MNSDRQVTAKMILKAIEDFQRLGSTRIKQQLEATEPDLAEHVLESLTTVFHGLLDTGIPHKEVRRLYRRVEVTVLVSILALRHAQDAMWGDLIKGTALAELEHPAQSPDPSAPQPFPPETDTSHPPSP